MTDTDKIKPEALNYILNLNPIPCVRCNTLRARLAFADYHVHAWRRKVTVNLVCHKSHHALGVRTINLTEIRFIETTAPWILKRGPKWPKGPK